MLGRATRGNVIFLDVTVVCIITAASCDGTVRLNSLTVIIKTELAADSFGDAREGSEVYSIDGGSKGSAGPIALLLGSGREIIVARNDSIVAEKWLTAREFGRILGRINTSGCRAATSENTSLERVASIVKI